MKRELLKIINVDFTLNQLSWITEHTNITIVFNDGVAYEYIGEVKL